MVRRSLPSAIISCISALFVTDTVVKPSTERQKEGEQICYKFVTTSIIAASSLVDGRNDVTTTRQTTSGPIDRISRNSQRQKTERHGESSWQKN
jgi:hypothetical protein